MAVRTKLCSFYKSLLFQFLPSEPQNMHTWRFCFQLCSFVCGWVYGGAHRGQKSVRQLPPQAVVTESCELPETSIWEQHIGPVYN